MGKGNELISTMIGGTFTIAAAIISGIIGVKWGKSNFSVSVNSNGNTIEVNGNDIPGLLSENDELRNEIKILQEELQGKEKELGDLNDAPKNIVSDINLVVDAVGSKRTYIGAVHNGELLLSTAALEDYFNEPVYWDAAHTTIYVGKQTDTPATEISLWNKNRLSVDKPEYLISDPDNNAFGFELKYSDKKADNYIVYALNGSAITVSGDIHAEFYNGRHDDVGITVNLLNENDEILYASPIISSLAPDLHFKAETKDCLNLKIAVEAVSGKNYWSYETDEIYVRNLTAVTTDY